MRQEMRDSNAVFSVRVESGNVFDNTVGKPKPPLLDQRPHRSGGDDLGVREQGKQRSLVDLTRRIDRGIAEGAIERELTVPRHGKLGTGMKAISDVRRHDLAGAIEFDGIESEGFRTRDRYERGFGRINHARRPASKPAAP
jgi:hypothetical protein